MRSIFWGRFRVSQPYRGTSHKGLDMVGVDSKEIHSPVDGIVRSSTIVTDKSDLTWEWGNYVRVDDAQGIRYYMCHMSRRMVKAGDVVKIGDVLGIEGNTGYTTGPHCHLEIRPGGGGSASLNAAEIMGIPNQLGTYTAPRPAESILTVSSGQWNVRYDPNMTGRIVGLVKGGASYPYTQIRDGWHRIPLGWIGPKAVAGYTSAPSRTYTVRKGDSFWKIAEEQLGSGARYGELASVNGMTPSDTIYEGQILKLP